MPPPGKGLLRSRIPPHALAVYPRLADITFIAQGHQHEQLFIDIFAAPAAQPLQRRDRRVDNHKIGLFAGLEIANLLVKAQRARAAKGRMLEGFAGAQAIALQLADLIRLAEGAQHTERGARANIATDAHAHFVLPAGR